MFGIGSTELLLIFVVGLIILGPKNLANMAKTLGKAMGEFRRVSTDFQRTINSEMDLEEHKERKKEAEKDLFPEDKDAKTAAQNDKSSEKVAEKKVTEKTVEPPEPAEPKNTEILSSAEKLQAEQAKTSDVVDAEIVRNEEKA